MTFSEKKIRKKLKNYVPADIYFLKKHWREWVNKRELWKFKKKAQKPNVQSVYDILKEDKIISIQPSRFDRFKARIKFHKNHDLVVIFQFNKDKERLEILTYYKEETNQRHKP